MNLKKLLPYFMLIMGAALFGSATPISKIVTESFSVFVGGCVRVLLAFLIIAPFIKWKKIPKLKPKEYGWLSIIGAVGVFGFTICLLYGMKQATGVTASIIMCSVPAVTAAASVLIYKDKFNLQKGAALALAVVGILVVQLFSSNNEGGSNSIWGILLLVGAVICEVVYTLLGKKLLQEHSALFVATFSAGVAFIIFLPFAIWEFDTDALKDLSTESIWSLVVYGAGTMGIGSVLWYNGVKKVEGSTAAIFMGVMPVSALLLSYFILDEQFQWIHLIGFGLVFAGLVLVVWSHTQKSKSN